MEFEAIVREFCAAVEAGDGTRLAALFTEDGIYHDTFYGAYQGREAIRVMLEERFYREGRDFLWEPRDMVSDGRVGYARWFFSYTSVMEEAAGKRVVAEGMSCFELDGGKIHHYSELLDAGKALVQLDFAPARMEKLLRRWTGELRADPALARHLKG